MLSRDKHTISISQNSSEKEKKFYNIDNWTSLAFSSSWRPLSASGVVGSSENSADQIQKDSNRNRINLIILVGNFRQHLYKSIKNMLLKIQKDSNRNQNNLIILGGNFRQHLYKSVANSQMQDL
jgi:hypothetical protein